jgi:hypothetical protein
MYVLHEYCSQFTVCASLTLRMVYDFSYAGNLLPVGHYRSCVCPQHTRMFPNPRAQSRVAFANACVRSVFFELFGCICIKTKDRAILIRSVHENVGS